MRLSDNFNWFYNSAELESINKKIAYFVRVKGTWLYWNRYEIKYNGRTGLYDLTEEKFNGVSGGRNQYKAPIKIIEDISINEFERAFEQFQVIYLEMERKADSIKRTWR